jgi:hypothetical protein
MGALYQRRIEDVRATCDVRPDVLSNLTRLMEFQNGPSDCVEAITEVIDIHTDEIYARLWELSVHKAGDDLYSVVHSICPILADCTAHVFVV